MKLLIRSFLLSVLAQTIGIAAGLITSSLIQGIEDKALFIGLIVLVHSMTAWLVSIFLNLATPWRIINLIFIGAILIVTSSPNSNLTIGIATLALVVLYLPTIWSRVPYYPTNREMYEVVKNNLPQNSAFSFIDLGSGFSGLLGYLAKNFPDAKFVGVELSPLAYLISKLKFSLIGPRNVDIYFKDIWKMNLNEYDFVYAFLAPPPMPILWEKANKEMRAGTTLLVNSFPCPAAEEKKINLSSSKNAALYIYKI